VVPGGEEEGGQTGVSRCREMDGELRKGGAHRKATMVAALILSLPATDSDGGVN
jgi:hypothetical protein